MNLSEAMAFLSVTENDDARAVKRAYHKGLKRHKPDSDPEGFKQLRAAFARMNEHIREREFHAFLESGPAVVETPQPLEQGTAAPTPPATESSRHVAAAPEPEAAVELRRGVPSQLEAVENALRERDITSALALVMDEQWALALLDDEDRSLEWATQRVSTMSILADRASYDALAQRYPELTRARVDEHIALLLRVSADWEHLLAHEDVPPAFANFVIASTEATDWDQAAELGRALGDWYWADPAGAWQFLSTTLGRRRALASYFAELLTEYEEMVEEGTQSLPIPLTQTPSRALAPLTTPFMVLAVIAALSTYIAMSTSTGNAWGIVGRLGLTALSVLLVMFIELVVYNAWPAIRRRYLHACMTLNQPPVDAAWSLTGHFMLRQAIAGDVLMDTAFRVGSLRRIDPTG